MLLNKKDRTIIELRGEDGKSIRIDWEFYGDFEEIREKFLKIAPTHKDSAIPHVYVVTKKKAEKGYVTKTFTVYGKTKEELKEDFQSRYRPD